MGFSSFVFLFIFLLVIVALWLSINIVPQSQNWVIESLGKYNRTLNAGFQLTIPFLEKVRYKVSSQEIQLPPDPINAITHDNVSISVQLAILYRITDPSRTMYRIENLELGIKTIINGTVRSELQHIATEWGIKLTRVEVTEVEVDEATKQAMQIQLNAERVRRGTVTEAEGKKQAAQLRADAELYTAQKKAEATMVLADAEAYAVNAVSKAISNGGASAVEFEIRKIQAAAVKELAQGNNTKLIMLPSDVLSSLSGTIGKIIEKI